MTIYEFTIPQLLKVLRNMDGWFAKATAHAEAKKFSPDNYVKARLAPDQFSFDQQIWGACDTAKFVAARLAGKDAPSHPDTETTFVQLRERAHKVVAYLESFTAADFAGADERKIALPRWEGKWMRGDEYAINHSVPNFYFHATTAYAILRHNGVDLGKRDYLGAMPFRTP
jgi:hypothetical protein